MFEFAYQCGTGLAFFLGGCVICHRALKLGKPNWSALVVAGLFFVVSGLFRDAAEVTAKKLDQQGLARLLIGGSN